jgi:hypothetical protein
MRRGSLGPIEYLRSFRRPLELSIFARDDPLPGLVAAPELVSRMRRRAPALLGRGDR